MLIPHPELEGHLLYMWQARPEIWFSENQLVFVQFGLSQPDETKSRSVGHILSILAIELTHE